MTIEITEDDFRAARVSDKLTPPLALITDPGVYAGMTSREYFAEPCPAPALTNSGIKTLLFATPAEFAYAHPALNPAGGESETNAAKRFGDVAHQIALGKGRGYEIIPFDTFASQEAKALKLAAEGAGLTPITEKKFAEAERAGDLMRTRFEKHLATMNGGVMPDYQTEVVAAWIEETQYGPIWCRMMMDIFCPALRLIRDPKFTKRLSDGVFEGHASAMGWDMQATWYLRGINALRPQDAGRWRFVNDCIHPEPPNVYRIREADEATRYSCEIEINRAISKFAKCLYSNEWPGYWHDIEPWTAKSWTMAERAARSMEDDQP